MLNINLNRFSLKFFFYLNSESHKYIFTYLKSYLISTQFYSQIYILILMWFSILKPFFHQCYFSSYLLCHCSQGRRQSSDHPFPCCTLTWWWHPGLELPPAPGRTAESRGPHCPDREPVPTADGLSGSSWTWIEINWMWIVIIYYVGGEGKIYI